MQAHLRRATNSALVLGATLLLAACVGTSETTEPEVDSNPTPSPPSSQTTDSSSSTKNTEMIATSSNPIHVEGHRGARGLKPENTLQAFETALDLGVTTLEFDLHLSADNQIVVWHDPFLGPDKCRPIEANVDFGSDGVAIASISASQLADYRCDLNPDPSRFPQQDSAPTQLAGEQFIPATLDEVFAFVARYAQSADKSAQQRAGAEAVEFNIETKRDPNNPAAIGDSFDGVNPGPFELAVLAAIELAGMHERVIVQSFDHRSLWAIHSVDPGMRLSALTWSQAPDFDQLFASGALIWSPNFGDINSENILAAHNAGLLVIPWTVNELTDMTAVLASGADGFITDRPDLARQLG